MNIKLHNKSNFMINTNHKKSIFCMKYSPDNNYFVTGSMDGTVRVFNRKNNEFVIELN